MKTNDLMIWKVCYHPPLSQETQKDIEKEVSWSMNSSDDSSKQYNLDFVVEWFKEFYDLEQIEGEIKDDFELLTYLLEQEVDYIEF